MIRQGPALALAGLFALLAACHTAPRRATGVAGVPRIEYAAAPWQDLPGWEADASAQAWPALLASCQVHLRPEWNGVCAAAAQLDPVTDRTVREFFAANFRPLRIIRAAGNWRRRTRGRCG